MVISINNVYFRFVNDAGDQITLRDTDDDGVATFDVSALNMNGSYTLQEASFTDVANNYGSSPILSLFYRGIKLYYKDIE